MSTLATAIITRLRLDVTLAEALYGGIYDRPPRASGYDATPDAFDRATGAVKPCASVFVDDAVRIGPGQTTRPVRVRVRGPKSAGRESVEVNLWRVRDLLHQQQVATPYEGAGVPLVHLSTRGPFDDPDLATAYAADVEFIAAAGPAD